MMTSCAYDVLSEHQQIRRLVDRLEGLAEMRGRDASEWLSEVRPVLEELAVGIVPHFAGEEAQFFHDVNQRLPQHKETVASLISQHETLGQDFVALRRMLLDSIATEDPPSIQRFADRMYHLLDTLRQHEEQENELMLLAYWQDLGEDD
jgi:hemerythrin-like domain-containing protein